MARSYETVIDLNGEIFEIKSSPSRQVIKITKKKKRSGQNLPLDRCRLAMSSKHKRIKTVAVVIP
ncbi:MAG TPA: hypothetical protein QF571_01090, partial [Desulfobacterales bacterium]|nr:hypothetical protein [Desulfobacterales bacterium]